MPGIPRELAEHALNVDPTAKPVQQSMRRFSEPKRRAIGEEINRLRKAGFIRELKESEWVANPVMVPKKDTTALRMCIDYTGLNKHCPKDHFPLPRIDQIVDSTAGCDRLSFLDAYSGYNQIKLKKEDQELTAFITPHGVFCYNVMTFGLKNAGATYQRCMQACLGEQIGRNIEVYIDDIMVKTKHTATLVDDLRETFDNLDRRRPPSVSASAPAVAGFGTGEEGSTRTGGWDGRRPRCISQSTGDAQDGKARLAQARLLPCRETTTATMRSRTSIPMFPRPSATFSSNSIA
ncbi:hypothetical protein QYE76_056775 [Lolium multiflorum]|uniref:Reverse transcriptase domain-containing protein n=1 Tax=Lolium multiflorum TaxID=4521 RepID=A0AAD8T3N9_LOLMU|nr:hypothetical protein QYE76_056775 [Lolium multiflorum]